MPWGLLSTTCAFRLRYLSRASDTDFNTSQNCTVLYRNLSMCYGDWTAYWVGTCMEHICTRTRQSRREKAVERRWNSRLISIPAQIYRIKFPTQIDSSPKKSHQIAPKTRLKSIPARLNRLKGLKEIGDFSTTLSTPSTGWMIFWATENHRCPT